MGVLIFPPPMLSLTLSLALAAAPGGLLSASSVASRHARFIETPVLMAGGVVTGQTVPYAQMTSLAELQAARAEEAAKRGSVGGFVAMAVVGGLAAFIAAPIMLYIGLIAGQLTTGALFSTLFIAGLVTFGVGAVLFGVGLGLLIATVARNARSGHNLRVIDRRMRELQKLQQAPAYQQPYAPEPYMPSSPTAPPPPPQGFLNVEPTLELASF